MNQNHHVTYTLERIREEARSASDTAKSKVLAEMDKSLRVPWWRRVR